jgi:SSS family solute:Na+ symporter
MQTSLFLVFGTVAFLVIATGMGGFGAAIQSLAASPSTAHLLTRERISTLYFFSYTFIPLSTIAFPHVGIFCLTARRLGHFRKTVVLYPICLLAIWLPSVFLGVVANAARDVPAIEAKLAARAELASPALDSAARDRLRGAAAGDDIILRLMEGYAPIWLFAILGACVMAAVMASDSQILALSTMFTEDVFAFYGGKARFGQTVQVMTGRVFIVVITLVAYVIALRVPQSIFEVATQYAFAGYSALAPLLIAALFWRRSTKWGALASTLWTAIAVLTVAAIQQSVPSPPPGAAVPLWSAFGADIITRTPAGAMVLGCLPVVPMTVVSALLMVIVSRLTAETRASHDTLARYFQSGAL